MQKKKKKIGIEGYFLFKLNCLIILTNVNLLLHAGCSIMKSKPLFKKPVEQKFQQINNQEKKKKKEILNFSNPVSLPIMLQQIKCLTSIA